MPRPIAIGGVGGSGTRLIASVVRSLGVHTGDDLNSSSDTLWFTLLFKRIEILHAAHTEFDLLTQALSAALQGGSPASGEIRSLIAACARHARPEFSTQWLEARAESLTKAAGAPAHGMRWGWKEPNTHVVIERLWQHLPDLGYIHVFRHGMDMAHSRNQAQLRLWGASALGEDGPCTPRRSLAYWCHVHRRMQDLHSRNRQRMYLLDYDAFCARPEQQAVPLLEFLGLPEREIPRLAGMIVAPRPRSERAPLESFAPRNIEYLRVLGYDVERSSAHA
ncbi:MAG: sulfotransferase [Pseudomonadota bacterium]|nr:sulfotransferase [Pseudomonadota bacterium]